MNVKFSLQLLSSALYSKILNLQLQLFKFTCVYIYMCIYMFLYGMYYTKYLNIFMYCRTLYKISIFKLFQHKPQDIYIKLQATLIKLQAEQVHSQLIVFPSTVLSSYMINHGEQSHQTTILRLETEDCHPDSNFKAINRTIHHKIAIRRL